MENKQELLVSINIITIISPTQIILRILVFCKGHSRVYHKRINHVKKSIDPHIFLKRPKQEENIESADW